MTERQPVHNRRFDSFADNIITQHRRTETGWAATLDPGLVYYASDREFSHVWTGMDKDSVISQAAKAIRQHAMGDTTTPQHPLFRSEATRLRLMTHWDKKERYHALGIDPNASLIDHARTPAGLWSLEGNWLRAPGIGRKLEFDFRLLVAEAKNEVATGASTVEEAYFVVVDQIRAGFESGDYDGGEPTQATWETLDERLVEGLDLVHVPVKPMKPEVSVPGLR